jgi:(1->4)-alpha-D-glucan 1-alpha-D-glucosylmutase
MGRCWRAGQLELRFDPERGSFAVWAYGSHKLPIYPPHYASLLGDDYPELERLGDAFSGLPNWRPRIAARAHELQLELASLARHREDVRTGLDIALTRLNRRAGALATWRGLDALIQQQHWRAAHFRVAADDINYRRFFNINELAGVRMELPELFDHAHAKIFELLGDDAIEGLRIAHGHGSASYWSWPRSRR